MTVETELNIATFVGDGVAVTFPFTFPVYDADHMQVWLRVITTRVLGQVDSADYSITGIGNESGGDVVFDTAPSDAFEVVLARVLPLTQDLDILNQGGFHPANLEAEFDILQMQIQQHEEEINRTVRGQLGEEWPEMPTAPVRRGALMAFEDTEEALPTIAGEGELAELLSSIIMAGSGISVTYDAGANTITIANTNPGGGEAQECWLLEDATSGGGSSGDAEFVRDTIFAALVGVGCTITQDDPGDTITITVTASVTLEQVYDAIASATVAGNGIILTDNDGADTTTIAVDPEYIRDTMGTALVGGIGIESAVSDGGDTITINIKPDIQTVVSAATVTPTFADNQVNVTALAVALDLANPTGTAVDGHGILIRITDNGTSRALTYGSKYREFSDALPAATTISKTLYIGIIYNAADDTWDVLGVREEA